MLTVHWCGATAVLIEPSIPFDPSGSNPRHALTLVNEAIPMRFRVRLIA